MSAGHFAVFWAHCQHLTTPAKTTSVQRRGNLKKGFDAIPVKL